MKRLTPAAISRLRVRRALFENERATTSVAVVRRKPAVGCERHVCERNSLRYNFSPAVVDHPSIFHGKLPSCGTSPPPRLSLCHVNRAHPWSFLVLLTVGRVGDATHYQASTGRHARPNCTKWNPKRSANRRATRMPDRDENSPASLPQVYPSSDTRRVVDFTRRVITLMRKQRAVVFSISSRYVFSHTYVNGWRESRFGVR